MHDTRLGRKESRHGEEKGGGRVLRESVFHGRREIQTRNTEEREVRWIESKDRARQARQMLMKNHRMAVLSMMEAKNSAETDQSREAADRFSARLSDRRQ